MTNTDTTVNLDVNLEEAGPSAVTNRIEALKQLLPEDHKPYTDKYFLRTNEILKAEGLNPWVKAQVFLRGGPAVIQGMDEAIAIIDKYSKIKEHGGRVYAKNDGDTYNPLESVMIIEAPVQDITELETMYLGVIAGETRKYNDGIHEINPDEVETQMRKVCENSGNRPVFYLGARHARWEEDPIISRAAFKGGAAGAATDIGAMQGDLIGMGTIPHLLENVLASVYGKADAVKAATEAFDKHIDPNVPRIALIDYNNQEITDSLATARSLGKKLFAVRVDTCGENVAEGAFSSAEAVPDNHPLKKVIGEIPPEDLKYWFGTGVTVSGVYALRKALDDAGFQDVKIILTSGFGSIAKDKAFVRGDEILSKKLGSSSIFDQLGVGKIFPSRTSTMDVVAVSDNRDDLDENLLSKVGRPYRPNSTLPLRLGGVNENI